MKKISCILLILSLSSCKLQEYTTQTRKELETFGIFPEDTQFYITNSIKLTSKRESLNNKSIEGSIVTKKEIVRNSIVFGKQFTSKSRPLPCVAKGTKDSRIAIYFEEGNIDSTRVQFIENNKGRYVINILPENELFYFGQYYNIEYGEDSKLYISKKEIKNIKYEKRKVNGLKLNR